VIDDSIHASTVAKQVFDITCLAGSYNFVACVILIGHPARARAWALSHAARSNHFHCLAMCLFTHFCCSVVRSLVKLDGCLMAMFYPF